MLVRIERRMVDVKDLGCAKRECFALGFDKGSFTPGVGYTAYHVDSKGRRVEHPVCMTRHLRGCPVNSVCERCRLCSVEPPGGECDAIRTERIGERFENRRCGGRLVERS